MKNYKGFSAVEGLLVLVIVGIIAATGYFVMHAQKQTNKSLDNAASSSQALATAKKNSSSKAYLEIKEWGVRAPYDGKLSIKYKIQTEGSLIWADFSSDELNASDPNCTTDGGYGGAITKIKAGQYITLPDGSASTQTIEQMIASDTLKFYRHLGDYYYFYQHPQAACGSSKLSNDLQSQTQSDVQAIVKNLE